MFKTFMSICLIAFVGLVFFCGVVPGDKKIEKGTELILRTDITETDPIKRDSLIEEMISILENRLRGFGMKGGFVKQLDADRLLVGLPNIFIDSSMYGNITSRGKLEFKFLETPAVTDQTILSIDSCLASKMDEDDSLAEDEDKFLAEVSFSALLIPADRSSFYINGEVYKVKTILANPDVQLLIPENSEFLFSTGPEFFNGVYYDRIYLVKKEVVLTGETLENIKAGTDHFNNPKVDFKIKAEFRAKWASVTGNNLQKPLAIVIDGRVESAPTIQNQIRGPGCITMRSGATYEEAWNLANLLKQGSYPANVQILECRIIDQDDEVVDKE